jgi:holo-[acyl-carrier protein] synthase
MDLIGLGSQIHDCARVKRLIEKHGEKFLYEVFTEREITFCNARTHSTEYFTALWASKDAVFRSLGTKWRRGMNWHDVEVVCESSIEPKVNLAGIAAKRAVKAGVKHVKLTFAYSRQFATATAMAMKG